jgi:NAD(P)-dependent dehydrogenase (short-subunit alcohol dehydrogenase family)
MLPDQVQALFDRVHAEQGRLDILVNDVWGGEKLLEFKPFWELSLEKGLAMLTNAVQTHLITARLGVPLMLETGRGLIVEVTDGNTYTYRGSLFYDQVKTSVIRLAFGMGFELRRRNIAAVALTPGFLRSEEMLEHFGVTEANWQDGAKEDPHFIASETPCFVGRAVAALAADPEIMKKSGRVFSSWDLSTEYGFTDIDGRRPHWGRHFAEAFGHPLKVCDDAFYDYWFEELPPGVMPDDAGEPTP